MANVVRDFEAWIKDHPNDAVAVSAIHALTNVLRETESTTIMELQVHIRSAADTLMDHKFDAYKAIQLRAACDVFVRHVTRTASLEDADLHTVKQTLIERGERFAQQSLACRQSIATLGSSFVHDASVVLVHGHSNIVLSVLEQAMKMGKRFRVIITNADPGADGIRAAKRLRQSGISTEVIIDSAVGHVMERVDMVLVGAQGVVENGGIINKIGTNQMAIVAAANKKPFYVAAESYKFARMYPLNQSDLSEIEQFMYVDKPTGTGSKNDVFVSEPILDYTPPQYIKLLFTDLGVLTPSAVSDELIKLYY